MSQLKEKIKYCQVKSNRAFLLLFVSFIFCSSALRAQQVAFKAGEKLKYEIYYGFISGGEAVLQVDSQTYKGKTALHLYLNGKTVGIANALYNVDDIYESFIDPETGWPLFSIRNIHENKYRHYSTQDWDHWSRKDSSIVVSSKTGKIVVSKGCQDILSSFYYLRRNMLGQEPELDKLYRIDTYFTDEKYPLIVRFKGRETIKTDIGKVRCLKFMPVVLTGRVFKSKDDMTIWFSDDNNFIPVRVKFEIFVGAVYCDLENYSNLANPFISLVKKK